MMKVNAEFVLQDGEAGPRICGLLVLLNPEDMSHYDGRYFKDVVVPMMTRRFMEDIDLAIDDGKLWEGAYLTTHPHDRDDYDEPT